MSASAAAFPGGVPPLRDKSINTPLDFKLVKELDDGNCVVSVSFVAASKACGNNLEHLKSAMA